MINYDLLRNIDLFFMGMAVFLIFITPLRSKHSKMMWLIGALFAANIGIAEMGLALVDWLPEVSQSISTVAITLNITISSLFAYLFWPKQINRSIASNINQYLTVLCLSMTGFYLIDMVFLIEELTYVATMFQFQVLMLVIAFWGVVDGNSYRVSRWTRTFYNRLYHRFHHNGK